MSAPAGSWEQLYRQAVSCLGDRNAARWMIEEVSGERLGAAVGEPPEKVRRRLADMLERRLAGEPLQYVLGSWAFRRLELMVDRRVLIPRPETEQVVEVALAEIDRLRGSDPGQRVTVVDLGTGSGAIALSLAAERTVVDVWATDRSAGAVAVARANLSGLAGFAATRVRLLEGDWWDPLPADMRRRIDLVVSNPPYISSEEMSSLDPVVVEWEPRAALEAGARGTEALEYLIGTAAEWLRSGGSMVVELAPRQAGAMLDAARGAGFEEAEVAVDLAGRDRILIARGAP